jgi:hypothetical protein
LLLQNPLEARIDQNFRTNCKVVRLNQLTIEKRKTHYIRPGIYSLSCQIFLTDLLRGSATVNPRHIGKIIVKFNDKVRNCHHYYAWLCTMLKIKELKEDSKWKVPLIFVCNQVHHYSNEEDLKEVYRLLFCSKVVIWPFGRAEINRKISQQREKCSLRAW